MQTLHINAENSVIDALLQVINSSSKEGKEVFIIDNKVFKAEKQMIDRAMSEIQKDNLYSHKEVWNELLDEN